MHDNINGSDEADPHQGGWAHESALEQSVVQGLADADPSPTDTRIGSTPASAPAVTSTEAGPVEHCTTFTLTYGTLDWIGRTLGFAPEASPVRIDLVGRTVRFTLTTPTLLCVATVLSEGEVSTEGPLTFALPLNHLQNLTQPQLRPSRGAWLDRETPYHFALSSNPLRCCIKLLGSRLNIDVQAPPPPVGDPWGQPGDEGHLIDPRVLHQALSFVAPAAELDRKQVAMAQIGVVEGRAVATNKLAYAQFKAGALDNHVFNIARANITALRALLPKLEAGATRIHSTEREIFFSDTRLTIGVRKPGTTMPSVPDLEALPVTLACRCAAAELDRWLPLAACLTSDRGLQAELALGIDGDQPKLRIDTVWGKYSFTKLMPVVITDPAHMAALTVWLAALAAAHAPIGPQAGPSQDHRPGAAGSEQGARHRDPELPLGHFPMDELIRAMTGSREAHIDLLWIENKAIAFKKTGDGCTAIRVLVRQVRNEQHGIRRPKRRGR